MEDVAGQYFGVSVSSYQFEELTRDVAALAHRKEFGSQELDRILITLGERAAQFLRAVRRRRRTQRASARTKRSSRSTKKPIATCCARWKWSRCNWNC